jgi:hypothetical protein
VRPGPASGVECRRSDGQRETIDPLEREGMSVLDDHARESLGVQIVPLLRAAGAVEVVVEVSLVGTQPDSALLIAQRAIVGASCATIGARARTG